MATNTLPCLLIPRSYFGKQVQIYARIVLSGGGFWKTSRDRRGRLDVGYSTFEKASIPEEILAIAPVENPISIQITKFTSWGLQIIPDPQ